MRIRQYNKSLFILLPLISSGADTSWSQIQSILLVSIFFSVLSSSIYVMNDLADIESDRKEDYRSRRPIAAGEVTKLQAIRLGVILHLVSWCFFAIIPSPNKTYIAMATLVYIVINILYSLMKLKNRPVIGIALVSIGFSIRCLVGILVLELKISTWALSLVFLLSSFLLIGKRFQSAMSQNRITNSRTSNVDIMLFWMSSLVLTGASLICLYIVFTGNKDAQSYWGKNHLNISVILVLLAILRYIELSIFPTKRHLGDVTEFFLKDPILILVSFLYLVLMGSSQIV